MSLLFIPANDEMERAAHRKEEARLLRLYKRDPKLRALSDRIHHSRMMGGRACGQCINMALRQTGRENEATQ